jgi:hypothetical protein
MVVKTTPEPLKINTYWLELTVHQHVFVPFMPKVAWVEAFHKPSGTYFQFIPRNCAFRDYDLYGAWADSVYSWYTNNGADGVSVDHLNELAPWFYIFELPHKVQEFGFLDQ